MLLVLGGMFSIGNICAQSLQCVAKNDCGVPGKQPFLIKGENYTMPAPVTGSVQAVTCNFSGTVIYAFNQLDINECFGVRTESVFFKSKETGSF